MRRLLFGWTMLGLLLLTQCQTQEDRVGTPTRTSTWTPTPEIGVALVTRAAPTTAVLQTTATPLPTPTATPTPTPIIYQIEAGDTLLGIAIQRGTTVEEIEALNPGIRPENLQIGQPVELPPPATALAQTAAGTPVPIAVDVNKFSSYQTPVGSLWLLGEVTNQGEQSVENVQIEVRLLDAAGEPLGTAVAWAALSIVPPGAKAPFGVLVRELPPGYAQPLVAVVGGQTLVDAGSRYLDVTVTETAAVYEGDGVQLEGTVHNTGVLTAGQVMVIATFYDSQGNVTGFDQIQLEGLLPTGETRPFSLAAAPPGGQTVATSLAVEALAQPSE